MDSTRPVGADAVTRRGFPIATSIPRRLLRGALRAVFSLVVLLVAVQSSYAQAGPNERTYRQSKSAVEKALKELQPSMSGRLPALEGFASPSDHPLNRYQRAYYQSAAQVSSIPSGIAGAGEHEGDGMVRGFSSISLGIPTADFEWPDRVRSSRPVNRSAGHESQCNECGKRS